MADPKDIMDVLTLIEDVGYVAAKIRKAGPGVNIWQELPALAELWNPIKTVIGEAPGAVVEVPMELGQMDMQAIQDVLTKFAAIYKAWAAVFTAA